MLSVTESLSPWIRESDCEFSNPWAAYAAKNVSKKIKALENDVQDLQAEFSMLKDYILLKEEQIDLENHNKYMQEQPHIIENFKILLEIKN